MTMVKQGVYELILLTLASVGVALAGNAVRERKSIELTKNYFDKGSLDGHISAADSARGSKPNVASKPMPLQTVSPPTDTAPANAVQDETARTTGKKHLEHDFQTISVEAVEKVLNDPQTAGGLNIFVDARDEEHFAEGHIPGALQCFPYEVQRCLDKVTAAAQGAENVIVYCGGGDCEDSIFMCRELVEAGVPHEAVFLFEGGWKEWSARGLHTETGK